MFQLGSSAAAGFRQFPIPTNERGVNEVKAQDHDVVMDPRGCLHPTYGTIFRKLRRVDGVVEYKRVEISQAWYENLVAFVKGEYRRPYTTMLVRTQDENGFNYFPLPMLYVSQAKRDYDSIRKGRRPMPEWRIKQYRQDIRQACVDQGIDVSELVRLEKAIDSGYTSN